MSLALSRGAVLRRAHLAVQRSAAAARATTRRAATTTSTTSTGSASTATAAAETAKAATSKASEGLTRVVSSAGGFVSRFGSVAGRALGGIGGRTGRLIGAVQSLIPPTIYYSRVGLELGRYVFESRKMSPPSMQVFQNYFTQFFGSLRNPSSFLGSSSAGGILAQLRNISYQQLAAAGIVTAEAIGFFSIGEMIGRFKLIGYRSSAPDHH